MSGVRFDRVSKVFAGDTRAVDGMDLEIADGEFMVLVGPSGCGKTTALRMVAGLEEISEGEISIGDRVVNHVPPRDRDIAMVFQSYALYPHLSVYENIAFGLAPAEGPQGDIDRRVRHAAGLLDLDPLLDRKPRALSGGQRQRVAMGRAIVREPQAFLMDEPLSNLDAKLRVQMRAVIARLQQDLGVTTIYVTHDQVEAMTMGDRVAVMRKGHLQQVATPQELYDRPVNLFVGGFIGSPAMNLLQAELADDGDGLAARLGSQRLPLGDRLLADHPALRDHVGRPVVLGVRPEALEDAAVARDEGRRGCAGRSSCARRSGRRSSRTCASTRGPPRPSRCASSPRTPAPRTSRAPPTAPRSSPVSIRARASRPATRPSSSSTSTPCISSTPTAVRASTPRPQKEQSHDHHPRPRFVLLGVLAALAVVFAGCGGDDDKSSAVRRAPRPPRPTPTSPAASRSSACGPATSRSPSRR